MIKKNVQRVQSEEGDALLRECNALRREVLYLRRISEQTIAKMLRLDVDSINIRHELEQKRRGFALMAELTGVHGRHVDYDGLFVSVSRRINAALGMQRTAVLVPGNGGAFRPFVLQGYPAGQQEAVMARRLFLPAEFQDPHTPVLVTGADSPDRFAAVREALALPFLIASPVFVQDDIAAVLITGRLLEQNPYMPRLGVSDGESVQTVSAHLATLLSSRLLVEAEQRTQIMLDAMPFCCTFWDEQHNIVDCNEAAPRLFGLSSKAEYLENYYRLSPEFQPNGILSRIYAKEKVNEAFSEGYSRFEWLHCKLNGELIPSEVTLVRVTLKRAYIVVGYMRDLREQKAMLAAMRKTQDELRRARDMAEQSAKAKSEFLANMSHEIRTPMNAILGMNYLLGRTGLTEKQQSYLEQADYSANLLLRNIDDIFDFAKLDSERMQLEAAEFSLRELIRRVEQETREEAAAKSLNVYAAIDDAAEDFLEGDPLRIEQVLRNLINNAVKFTPDGGMITLRVERQPSSPGTARLLFRVADTGIGMSEELVARLFTPFSQADSSATRRHGGMGLGLAISRLLVNLMHGDLTCTSVEGQGSEFTFAITLPVAGSADVALDKDGQEAVPYEEVLRGMRVLLAEDNEINQIIAAELLAAKGVAVRIVATGQEAVDALAEDPFDLILMDIQMPVMDGLAATTLIRSGTRQTDIPIIAMTAHAMAGDREISLAAGMNDHITKPIDPGVLYAALARWRPRPAVPVAGK